MKNFAAHRQKILMSERIERDAWLDQFAAAPASYHGSPRVHLNRFGPIGALAHVDIPITELNRALSVMDASLDELKAAKAWLNKNAMEGWAFQIPDIGIDPLLDWLKSNSFVAKGDGWAKFHSRVQEIVVPGKMEVKLVTTPEADLFGHVVQAGFGLPNSVVPWFASLVGRANWRTYLAYEHGEAVACGAMFIDDAWAWLGIDATLEQHRGKGAQKSIIARRLQDGMINGVHEFTAETGRAAEGSDEPNISHDNFVKSGFAVLSVRSNFVLDSVAA